MVFQKKSAVDALYEVKQLLYNNLKRDQKCIGIFGDVSKALDTIQNKFLPHKFEIYRVRDVDLHLMQSYLFDKRQKYVHTIFLAAIIKFR